MAKTDVNAPDDTVLQPEEIAALAAMADLFAQATEKMRAAKTAGDLREIDAMMIRVEGFVPK